MQSYKLLWFVCFCVALGACSRSPQVSSTKKGKKRVSDLNGTVTDTSTEEGQTTDTSTHMAQDPGQRHDPGNNSPIISKQPTYPPNTNVQSREPSFFGSTVIGGTRGWMDQTGKPIVSSGSDELFSGSLIFLSDLP